MGRVRPPRFVSLVLLTAVAACGRGDAGPEVWTGRVTSKTERQYCLTPDRGTRFRCVDVDRARGEIEVGQCVEAIFPEAADESSIEVVDEAACAAGDLGD